MGIQQVGSTFMRHLAIKKRLYEHAEGRKSTLQGTPGRRGAFQRGSREKVERPPWGSREKERHILKGLPRKGKEPSKGLLRGEEPSKGLPRGEDPFNGAPARKWSSFQGGSREMERRPPRGFRKKVECLPWGSCEKERHIPKGLLREGERPYKGALAK